MFRSNVISKTGELIAKDTAGNPDATDTLGMIRGAVGYFGAKIQRLITRPANVLIDLPSDKQYALTPRNGITSETRAMIQEVWETQWVHNGIGRIVNVVPKAIKALISAPDAIGRDALQLIGGGRPNDGYRLTPVGNA